MIILSTDPAPQDRGSPAAALSGAPEMERAMKQIKDPAALKRAIDKNKLQDMFSLDLCSAANLVHYDAGELIGQMGAIEESFIILLEGECMAYVVTGADKIHCECHYRGVNIMGMVSVLWRQPSINSIRTITPCVCLSIPAEPYREALLNDVKFLRTAVEWLAAHIRKSAAHFEPLETRLAGFILEMEQDGVFRYNLTLCADLLECSYRHLLRTLRAFCDMGLLQKRAKGSYAVTNRPALQDLQSGTSLLRPQLP